MRKLDQLGVRRAQLVMIIAISLTFGTATAFLFPGLAVKTARVRVSLTDPPFDDGEGYSWDDYGRGRYKWENYSWQDFTRENWSNHWRLNYGPRAWENYRPYRPYTWENYEWCPPLREGEYPQIFGCTVYEIKVTLKIELHKDDCTWHTIIDGTFDMVELMRAAENRFVDIPVGHYDRVRITVSKVEVSIEVPNFGKKTTTITSVETFEMEIDLTITIDQEYDLRFDFDARASLTALNPMTRAGSWQTSQTSVRAVCREHGKGWEKCSARRLIQ